MSTLTATPTLDVSQTARVPFARLVKVELRKMADTRAGFWLLVLIGAITAAIDIGMLLFAALNDNAFSEFDFVTVPSAVLGILLPVLGVMAITSEFSQRTAMVTYTLEPHRSRVIWSKLTATVIAAVMAVVAAVIAGVVANLVYAAIGSTAAEWNFHLANFGAFLLLMVISLLTGFVFGMVIGNTAAAIVFYFIYNFVITGLLSWLAYVWGWFDKIHRYVDFNYTQSDLQDQHLQHVHWAALLVSGIIWLVLPLVFGFWRLLRAEVK